MIIGKCLLEKSCLVQPWYQFGPGMGFDPAGTKRRSQVTVHRSYRSQVTAAIVQIFSILTKGKVARTVPLSPCQKIAQNPKGPGKRGHIVADTFLPMMFLGLRKLGNICCGHKMFLNKIRNIFWVPDTKLVSETNVARVGKRENICVGNKVHSLFCWAGRKTSNVYSQRQS